MLPRDYQSLGHIADYCEDVEEALGSDYLNEGVAVR